jgi:hypothetical protein
MAIPYTQTSMALVRAVDGTYISYPFIESGDTTTKVYNLVCTQRASDYNAAQIDLDDNMSSAANAGVIDLPSGWADSNAYFVGDTGHAPIGGGMISFTRTFANIPQSTTIASGSAFVAFPGISSTITLNTALAVTSITMTSGTKGVTIITATHSLTIGDNVNVALNFTVGSNPFIYSVTGNYRVLAVPTTTAFVIDIGHYWGEQVTLNIDSGRVWEASQGRQPVTRNVSTQTRYDYILPGVTPSISSVLDVNLPSAFAVVGVTTGTPTDVAFDTYTNGFGTFLGTLPDATEYVDMIDEEMNIIIESSLSEWAGNILVQKTKTCKAR